MTVICFTMKQDKVVVCGLFIWIQNYSLTNYTAWDLLLSTGFAYKKGSTVPNRSYIETRTILAYLLSHLKLTIRAEALFALFAWPMALRFSSTEQSASLHL